MTIEIRSHLPGECPDEFFTVARDVYRDDPHWVPPFEPDIRSRLDPAKDPFFEHASAMIFTAHRGGRAVGRITAQVDQEHLRFQQDDAGFFGFFDTIDDVEVAGALIDAASEWTRAQGMKLLRGPYSLTIDREAGLLIDGFDHPPMISMAHSRSYQAALAEAVGMKKAKDLYAWRYAANSELNPFALAGWELIGKYPEVSFRTLDPTNMRAELAIVREIFNEAWRQNWGFVPATEAEAGERARVIRSLLDQDLSFFVEIDGRPVGVCIFFPNHNESMRGFDGKVSMADIVDPERPPKVPRPKTGRLTLLGIRPELRGVARYKPLAMAMFIEVARRGRDKGYEYGELSWTLEDNFRINRGIELMGATRYKTYRVYERVL